jgi:hypothetical protein
MSNVAIAKAKLQCLKVRTEKDLYGLEFDSMDFMPLTEDTFYTVKMVCNDNDLICPLYKYRGEVKFRRDDIPIFTILHMLAKEYGIYLDYTKIPQ